MNQDNSYENRLKNKVAQLKWHKLHLDPFLLLSLILLFGLMYLFAQISPHRYRQWAPWLFGISFVLLLAVLAVGKVDLGAKRWLSLGFFRFQPSELMTLAMPIMLAWFLSEKTLPPNGRSIIISSALIIAPALLIAKQPDLGTAIIVAFSGIFVLLLAGMRWKIIGVITGLLVLLSPLIWHFMHPYQKERVLTFLNPERDPLGSGYHIIQ